MQKIFIRKINLNPNTIEMWKLENENWIFPQPKTSCYNSFHLNAGIWIWSLHFGYSE